MTCPAYHRIKADTLRAQLYAPEPDPWRGKLAQVLCEGRGPGPRNVLCETTDGARVVLVRREKSLFKRAELPTLEIFK